MALDVDRTVLHRGPPIITFVFGVLDLVFQMVLGVDYIAQAINIFGLHINLVMAYRKYLLINVT